MPSFKNLAAGLVALLTADAVVASPCKVNSITTSNHALSTSFPVDTETIISSSAQELTSTTVEAILSSTVFSSEWSSVTELSTTESDDISSTEIDTTTGAETSTGDLTMSASVTETTSTLIESSDVSSATETATSAEMTTSADASTITEAISTSTEMTYTTTTVEVPPVLPTVSNLGFDDNSDGRPWIRTGSATVSSATVYWKRSAPNVMVMRPGTSIAQQINDLRSDLTYRIRFYYVEFDTPSATAGCKISATLGDQSLGEVSSLPPRTPSDNFEEFISLPFRPSTASALFKIEITCGSTQTNRYYIDDVSIEFA
ncbi:hypothetical protein FLONG3_129 [Fusarium longipes]|uniref:CBM-cenC domain-containing protein n=1 Tax=Fusarium longipes TaxID=694270 RepID=A0A395TAG9_9HYPO|nr:hypothetical protein FLONG3_129 [Fusarium longipes]